MKTLLLTSMLALLSANTLWSDLVFSVTTSDSPLAVSSIDLLQTDLSNSVLTDFAPHGTFYPIEPDGEGLFNGSYDSAQTSWGNPYIHTNVNTDWNVEFLFDLSENTLGYDLTGIDVISGWNQPLASQNFTLEYKLVGASDFILLGSVNELADPDVPEAMKVSITENITGILASGVASIRFTHHSTGDNDGRGAYREIDVFGTPTPIPEPGTLVLMLCSLMLMVLFRRR